MNPEDDKCLDRLLAGVGSAKVEAGFEQRILRGVETKVSAKRPSRRMMWVFGLASACAALVAATVIQRPVPQATIPQVANGGNAPRTRSDVSPTSALRQGMTIASSAGSELKPGEWKPGEWKPGPRTVRHSMAEAARLATSSVSNESALSYPAPPLPLTEQERLLLKVIHQGDPVEMAMLDPEVRQKLEAEDTEEFKEFFMRPPPPPLPDVPNEAEVKEKGDTR